MKIFAAHNPDADIRKESSAGGVFSILASKILQAGGIVYGVGFNSEWEVVHLRIDREDELWRIRGSKYVYSHIGTSITDACRDLDNGHKVLFSGTPCQVAAMRKRAGDNPNLLLVEVICHGAPEPKYWQRYLDEICTKHHRSRSDIQSINFRDKRTGWKDYSYTISFSDGYTFSEKHPDNLYFRAFIRNYTLREACFKCPFKLPHNKGDIILGDFWGIGGLAPEMDNNKGTTLCLIATENGHDYITDIESGMDFSLDSILSLNKSLIERAQKPADYSNFIEYSDKCYSILKALKKFAALSWRTKINIKIAKSIRFIINS